MFFDKFKELCAERGVSLSRAVTDLDMSKASISRWKAGGSPTNSSKRKIADYFGVSIAELNGTTEKPAPQTERELTDLERSLINDIMMLPDDLKRLVVAQIKAWRQTD